MSAGDPRRRIALAIDAPSVREVTPLVELLAPHVGVLKVGLELFMREGPAAVAWARGLSLDVFLDLKLHDIPETVERAVAAACAYGVRYLSVHAQGGQAMLERAVERAAREQTGLSLLAVTVLTSLDASDLAAQGVVAETGAHALRLARLAHAAGVRGFVSSAAEVAGLRAALGDEAILVTPGIRPNGSGAGDQKRIATPRDAIAAGADLLVLGRPLRDALDPVAVAVAVARDIALGLEART